MRKLTQALCRLPWLFWVRDCNSHGQVVSGGELATTLHPFLWHLESLCPAFLQSSRSLGGGGCVVIQLLQHLLTESLLSLLVLMRKLKHRDVYNTSNPSRPGGAEAEIGHQTLWLWHLDSSLPNCCTMKQGAIWKPLRGSYGMLRTRRWHADGAVCIWKCCPHHLLLHLK